jgi:tetratricopeptide (TPR) repeat protein
MNRKITLVLLIAVICTVQPLFAAVSDEGTTEIPLNIRNNEYYIESMRLAKLAMETYDYGDYEASTGFAEEAIRYALLSDEYIAVQLSEEAKRLLDLAVSENLAGQNADEYRDAKNYYEAGLEAQADRDWTEAIEMAATAIELLAFVEGREERVPVREDGTSPLPAQYTVRTWEANKDCLWNIAAYSWVYGDPQKWRVLYDANKAKLPDPNNPHLIEPGMVLQIPSIRGEVRQGMWDSRANYTP